MSNTRRDLRNSILCSIVSLAALLMSWPFANLSFNDDWTWALTVKRLSETGHLMYNGWSSPSVIAQAYWGLLWVKLFGFSFNILRVSSLPIAAGAVGLCYLLARRSGLSTAMAVFIALMLGLSPVYMPIACTFMTDVPGLFFMLLAMLALQRGLDTEPSTRAAGWLLSGALAAVVGGSSRQVVWVVPLVLLPYFALLRRKDFLFVAAAVLGWSIVFTGAVAMQHWFARQPYSIPDPPMMSYVHVVMKHPKTSAIGVISVLLTMLLLLLPAAAGGVWFKLEKPPIRFAVIRLAVAVPMTAAMYLLLKKIHHELAPWIGNIFTTTGVLSSVLLAGGRPVVLGDHTRLGLSLLVLGTAALLLASAIIWICVHRRSAISDCIRFFFQPQEIHPAVPAMLLLSLALFALEMTRSISTVAYDRHLLVFIPFAGIPLLVSFQCRGMTRLPIWSWAILTVYALYAVASTQEVNSLARARVAAVHRLKEIGVHDNQIDAGFEHNYFTQAALDGHINDARLRNPPGAYDKTKGPTPALNILYRLESKLAPGMLPTACGTITYFSLLPPFHRTIFINEFADAWWLNPTRAATRPVERQLLPQVLLDQYNH